MRFGKKIFFVLLALPTLGSAFATDQDLPSPQVNESTTQDNPEEMADSFYQKGDCVRALVLYRSIYGQPGVNEDLKI